MSKHSAVTSKPAYVLRTYLVFLFIIDGEHYYVGGQRLFNRSAWAEALASVPDSATHMQILHVAEQDSAGRPNTDIDELVAQSKTLSEPIVLPPK